MRHSLWSLFLYRVGEEGLIQGHVRKRRTWEFIVDIGLHPVTGRRRQKSKSGFATKKDAESALHEFIRYIEGGGDPSPERIGLGEYLNRWLEYQRARGIRSRTLEGYEGYIRREVVPVIGGLELAKVRPGHVRAVLARVQQRGLSAATTAQVRSVLGSALRQAVADGLIAANPVAAVKRPRVQRRELRWPTSVQLGALLEVSRDTMWDVPILLAAVTGARRSEVLGPLPKSTDTFSPRSVPRFRPRSRAGGTRARLATAVGIGGETTSRFTGSVAAGVWRRQQALVPLGPCPL